MISPYDDREWIEKQATRKSIYDSIIRMAKKHDDEDWRKERVTILCRKFYVCVYITNYIYVEEKVEMKKKNEQYRYIYIHHNHHRDKKNVNERLFIFFIDYIIIRVFGWLMNIYYNSL